MNKQVQHSSAAGGAVVLRGCHFAAGVGSYRRGEPRELPKYFTKPSNHNANAWLNGWDYGKVLTAAPAQQSFEAFCENTLIINVHRGDYGQWKLGRALDDTPADLARLRRGLVNEYTHMSAAHAHAHALLDHFERTLTNCDLVGDVVLLDGHKVRGKHFILNTMLVMPPDILERVYSDAVRRAAVGGEPVFVPEAGEDPREALLARRHTTMAAESAVA
ncbi:hypothetical protein [Paraburkholderia youngii]|uniref:hypothetical protein n=1 Tax=Paraburkholderia youngii TaxID=2782701 RepID=UPI003D214A1A